MKKITLLITLLLLSFVGSSQTTLTAGDIAFVGSNVDGATNADDTVAFLLLKDIDAATTIIFTDMGWNDGTGFFTTNGDGEFTWLSGIARNAGDVVTIDMSLLPFPAAYSFIGDQLFALQGSTAAPVFIAGLQFNDTTGDDINWDGAATSNSTSALPDALITGSTAVRLVPEQDNWQFSCVLAGGSPVSGTAADIRAIVHNRANWLSNNDTPYIPAQQAGCTFTVTAGGDTTPPVITCAPEPLPITAGTDGLAAIPDLVSGTSAIDDVSSNANITITQSPTAGTMYYAGVYPVTLTATDEAGNTDTCIINVTINEPPFTVLAAGDIAFVGFNLDNGDGFAFILLQDIIAGTHIRFTDCGVTNPNTISCIGSGDGSATWYSASAMSAGAIVSLPGSFMASSVLSSIGDQLFAYQGAEASATFITGIHSNVDLAPTTDADWDGVNTSSTTSALPDQLTNGVNAIRLYTAGPPEGEVDNWQFDCSSVPGGFPITGTAAEIAAIVNDIQYWSSNDVVEYSPTAMGGCSYNVLPSVDDTNVTLVAGVLTIEDTVDKNDDLTIKYNAATNEYIITDNNGGLISCSISGATGSGTNEVRVPNIGITSILTTTLGGDDMFIVDFSGDDFPVAVTYEGGLQATGDALALAGGGTFTDITHNFTNENDGSIDIAGNGTISYTGLEPIIDNLLATNRVFNFTGGAETITLSDDVNPGDNISFIDSSLGESVVFVNPTASLTINTEAGGGSGADIINIEGLDSLFDADLTVNGGNDDDVFFQNNPTNAGTGDVVILGQTINVLAGPVTAGGDIALTAGGEINTPVGIPAFAIFDATNTLFNGILAVGQSPGQATVNGNFAISTGDTVEIEVDDINTPGTEYDQIVVNGALDITDAFLTLIDNFAGTIPSGNSLTIIDNDGADPVVGTFSGLPNGTAFTFNGQSIIIKYDGGDGNDIVLVADTPPTAICQDITVQLDGTGNITIVPSQVDGGSSDPDGPVTLSVDKSSFDCSDIGPNTVTLTVTDNTGNTASCTATVTVKDMVPPVANCAAPFTIQLDATGNASITVGDIENGSTDACGIATTTINKSTFTCADVGSNTITLTVTDVNGNISTCTTVVTVEDSIRPVITCKPNGTRNTNAGLCQYTVVGTEFDATFTDNCGGSIANDYNLTATLAGEVFPVGSTIVNWAANSNGQFAFCQTIITVIDNELPVANCAAPFTIQLDAAGNASITAADIENGSTDNCGIATTTIDKSTFTCADVGPNTITLTVTDVNGNVSTCTTVVTVEDRVAPVANCAAPFTIQLDAAGNASITVGDIDNGSTDACGIATTTIDKSTFTCADVGPNTITLTVTDVNGNVSTCTTVVTVEDRVAPVANCAAPFTIQLDAAGNASITVGDIDNGSTDACGIATTTIDKSTFTCADVGPNTITLTVTDVNGNVSTCTTVVTVEDRVAPVANCAAPFTIQLDAAGNASITVGDIDNGSTDACGIATTTIDKSTFTCADVGPNTITLTVTDVNGNVSTCTTVVTVEDRVAPVANCAAPFTIQLDAAGNASITVGDIDNGSTDACGIATTTIDKSTFTCADVGPNTITLTVTDVNGNVSTCTTVVTVEDRVAPVANCAAPFTIQLDAAGNASITVGDIDNGSTDACGIATTTIDKSTFTCADVGPNTITLTVTDVNGNVSTCTTVVTVEDRVAPVANCAAPFTIQLDAAGNASITVGDIDNGSTDACGIATTTIDKSTFTCADVGPNTITLTVTDVNGNVSTCTTVVTVEDRVAPVANCAAPFTIQLDAAGNASITVGDIDNGSTDACGIATTTIDKSTFTCADVGPNTITLTVTDVNGNVSTCTTVVTVEDRVAPVANCAAPFTIQLDAAGNASITVGDIDNGSTDACGIATTTIDKSTFTCADVGPNTITLTVTDVNGNVSTCTTVVTVEDRVAPVANCAAPFTIQLDAAGNASITVGDIDNGSTDACGIATTTIDKSTFTCADVGPNTITLTVTDVNGNVSTCTTVVTVEDRVAPVANCAAPFTIQLDAAGNASITVGDIDNGSTDACGIATTTIDKSTFTCADVGPNTITLTVTDVNGNVSTCTTVVTVEDSILPTILCPADITANTDAGQCFATVNFVTPVAFDNCGIASIVQTMGDPSGSGFPVGVNTIEFTATDVNGNTSTCSFTITVTDNEAPVAVCQNITIQLDANGNATITAADVDGGSTDQCGVASLAIDVDTFDCSNIGDNNVILTVTDVNGNTSTCTAIVTVEDVTAPTVVCQNITVELDPVTGTVTIAGIDVDGGSTDACGIDSYTLDMDTFDCSNVGDNTVTLTVTDVNGNTATCTAIVTVEDNTSPVLVCQDFTLELGVDGTAILDPSNVIASNDDACGIFTSAVDITDFDCSDIGAPITVQVFTIDNNGNLATCTAEVTVVDRLAPVITCPIDQTVDPGPGTIFYILPDYFATGEATAIDNCTIPVTVTTQSPAAGTPLSDGTYTITLTATDEYGNTSTCDFELIVESVLGVGDNSQDFGSILMYPVPTKNILNISNPQSLELERLEIYDLRGRLVQSADLRGMGNVKTINVDQLAAASYYVKIKGANGEITKRLLKE